MRVCVLNPNYYRSSGVTTVIRRLISPVDSGIVWRFVSCGFGSEACSSPEESALLGRSVNVFGLMCINPLRFLSAFLGFLFYTVDERIDVIHVHHRRLLVVAWAVKCVTGVKVVYTGQLVYPRSRWLLPFRVDIAVGISNSVMRDIRETISAEKFFHIGNPAVFPASQPKINQYSKIVICVARLAPVKNHKYLFEAWRMVQIEEPSALLLLVGEGQLAEELKQQAKDLGIENSIRFLGFSSNWSEHAAECSFAILPSLVEGHPVVVVEAAACGLPTLVTDADGNRDVVPPAVSLENKVCLTDSGQFARVIVEWLRSPDKVAHDGGIFFSFHNAMNSSEAVRRLYIENCWRPLRFDPV